MRARVGDLGVMVAALVVLAACSDAESEGDEGEPGSGSGAQSPERFERAMAEAVCEAVDRCNLGGFATLVRQDGRCVEAMQRYISGTAGGMAHLRAAVRFGEVGFDANAARACLDSFAGRCPQSFDLLVNGMHPVTWCPEAFPGNCRAPDKLPWVEPLARGEHCNVVGGGPECAAGLACGLSSNTCQPCGNGDDGLDCQEPPTEGLTAIYLTDRPEGSRCEWEGVRAACNPGLVCNFGQATTCISPRPAGMACPEGAECAGNCDPAGVCQACD